MNSLHINFKIIYQKTGTKVIHLVDFFLINYMNTVLFLANVS